MFRLPFVPARNSRHRVATLALYRALVKTGKKVPLPKDLQHPGPTHPIAHIVKKRFAKHKPYTSLRLVYNSIASGYKFLTLLTKGQTVGNPEHSQIIEYLRKRNQESALSRSKAPPRSPPKYNPPLLTKVSNPDEPPKYVPTVRPLPKAALSGERRVPIISATAEGVPFLRIKKPQPRVLSRSIARKTMRLRKDIYGLLDSEEVAMPSADQEERWDSLVNKQMIAEGLTKEVTRDGPLGSYRWSQYLARVWLDRQVNRRWSDFLARGEALSQLVETERVMAQREKQSPVELPDDEDGTKRRELLDTILEDARQMVATGRKSQGEKPFEDPFQSKSWIETVRVLESTRLKREQNVTGPKNIRRKEKDEPATLLTGIPLDEFDAIRAARR